MRFLLIVTSLAPLIACADLQFAEDRAELAARVIIDDAGVPGTDGRTRTDTILASDAAPDATSDANADAAIDPLPDAAPIDTGGDVPIDAAVDAPMPPPPPVPTECTPEATSTYDDIRVVRQDKPARGTWARVAVVSWDMADAHRNATANVAAADKKANLDMIDRLAAIAKKQCVELLILPEMAVVGYPTKESDTSALKTSNFRSRAEAASYAESLPAVGTARANIAAANHPAARRLADAAATNTVAIHAGLLEDNAKAKPFNTTLVFDKAGTFVARHRKHNVNDPLPLTAAEDTYYYEREYLSEGADPTVYVHPRLGRVAVMTCADMYPQMNEEEQIVERPPYWREQYLAGGAFSLLAVGAAWNDPWKTPPNLEWTAMNQVAKLSTWANPGGARDGRYVAFANTVSNGKQARQGFSALVAPVKDTKVETAADKTMVIGYVPVP